MTGVGAGRATGATDGVLTFTVAGGKRGVVDVVLGSGSEEIGAGAV